MKHQINHWAMLFMLLTLILTISTTATASVQAHADYSSMAAANDGPIYIFNALWFDPHRGQERYAAYAADALPLLQQHGGEPVGIYRPTAVFEGNFDADAYVLVKWPTVAAFESFWNDPHYQGLKARRAQALRDSILVMMQPTPGFPSPEQPLPGDGVNEPVVMLNALWFEPDGGAELYADYLQKTAPIGTRYGAHSLGFFTPMQVLEGALDVDELAFVQWPSAGAVEALFRDPDFQPLAAQRAAALADSWLVQSVAMTELLPPNSAAHAPSNVDELHTANATASQTVFLPFITQDNGGDTLLEVASEQRQLTVSSAKTEKDQNKAAFPGYPYRSHFIDVGDNLRMHYLDEGHGQPIVLLHGLPTSSYMWRNVIPHLAEQGRVIAVDLVNFGLSDKESSVYTVQSQVIYLERLIDELGLENIRFVLHDWGGLIGFAYAMQHPEKAAGIAFFETAFAPFPTEDLLPPEVRTFRDPETGRHMVIDLNIVIEGSLGNNQALTLPPPTGKMTLRDLSAEELNVYRQPFLNPADREVLYQFPLELAFLDQPGPNLDLWLQIAGYMATADIPKLNVYGNPGFGAPGNVPLPDPQTGEPMVDPITGLPMTLQNIVEGRIAPTSGGWIVPGTTHYLQTPSTHFIPEDAPHELGQVLANWLDENF